MGWQQLHICFYGFKKVVGPFSSLSVGHCICPTVEVVDKDDQIRDDLDGIQLHSSLPIELLEVRGERLGQQAGFTISADGKYTSCRLHHFFI